MSPVLFVMLSFDRSKGMHEATQFKHYDKWLQRLARTTRCDLDAPSGWDERDKHLHLEVRVKKGEEQKFFSRLPRFNVEESWKHKTCDVKIWDEKISNRSYIREKHTPVMLCACGSSSRKCRKGKCSFRQEP